MKRQRATTIGRLWAVLATLAALSLVAGACGGDDGGDAFDADDAAVSDSDASATADTDDDDSGADAGDDSGDDDAGEQAISEDVENRSESDSSSDGADDPSGPDGAGRRTGSAVSIPQGHDGFCGDFYEFLQRTLDLLDVYFNGDPAALEAAVGPLREAMAAIEASVPAELGDDLQQANQYFETMIDVLEAHDYDAEAANADPAMANERTGAAARAEERLHTYVVDECDYDPEAIGLSPPD